MAKLFAIAWFEFGVRLKRISTWVYFVVFFALAMLWIAAAGGLISSAIISFGSGKVWVNSPYAIAQTTAFLGMLRHDRHRRDHGPRRPAGFRIPQRDLLLHRADRQMAIPGRPLSRRVAGAARGRYRASRSAAGWARCCPDIDPDRVGPARLAVYLTPFFTVLLPNLILIGGVFFCLAALTRRMLPVYIGSVVCLLGYLAGNGLMRDIENKTLAAMLDPFGSRRAVSRQPNTGRSPSATRA